MSTSTKLIANGLEWLANGETGTSSKAMFFAASQIPQTGSFRTWNYPHDPDDLNRCRLLLEAVPEVRDHFDKVATLSPVWAQIIENWDSLIASLLEELPSSQAPQTYGQLRRIIELADTPPKTGRTTDD